MGIVLCVRPVRLVSMRIYLLRTIIDIHLFKLLLAMKDDEDFEHSVTLRVPI